MEAAALGFLMGILCVQVLPELPAQPLVFGLVCAVAVLVAALWKLHWPNRYVLRLAVIAMMAGVAWGLLQASFQLSDRLDPRWEGQKVSIEGRVDGLVSQRGDRVYFPFRVKQLGDESVDLRLRVSWWRADPVPAAGEVWGLPVRLRGTRGFRNPGLFDYEGWLFRQGYDGRASVMGKGEAIRLSASDGLQLQSWRREIGETVVQRLDHDPTASMIRALVVGDRQDISQAQWEVLRRTGTGHLVAISGLHVALMSGMVFWLGLRLWGRLGLWVPAPVAAAVLALLAAALYAAFAGFAVPTQRALIMLSVVLGAVILRRAVLPGYSLSVALLAVLLIDPMAVLAPGFWLSFLAVAAILSAIHSQGKEPFWIRWPRLQLVIALALFPMSLYWFDQASLIAPLVNLLAVPVVGFVVVPLSLLGALMLPFTTISTGVLRLAHWVFDQLWWVLEQLSAWPWAQLGMGHDPVGLALIMLAVGIFLLPKGLVPRWLAWPLLLPLFIGVADRPDPGEVDLSVLDVGQGLAVFVQTHEHSLVYDTGPRFRSGFDTGRAVMLPYLRHKGIDRLDALVVSHGDIDHSGGSASLVAEMPPLQIWLGEDLSDITGRRCGGGESWSWDGVHFEFLGPEHRRVKEGNNASCVLRIEAAGRVVLLPGDIEASMERKLLASPKSLKADLVLAPHHGSLSSSTPLFVAATRPQWVIFAAGHRNRFGFPKQPVEAIWHMVGAKSWNTGEQGAGRWRIDKNGRIHGPWGWGESRRYWHSPLAH